MQLVGQTWLNLVTWTCGSWSEGQHDIYFTFQWFCLISWSLFCVCTSYWLTVGQGLLSLQQVRVKEKCFYFFFFFTFVHFPLSPHYYLFYLPSSFLWETTKWPTSVDLLLNPKAINPKCMYTIFQDYESVWPEVWPQNKCRSLWPIFHGPVLWPCILNVIWWMNFHDMTFDLKINVGLYDLYFMAQWFCLIFLHVLLAECYIFRWDSVTQTLTSK